MVGVNADGTYTVEYVDEGLVEEAVPESRIRRAGEAGEAGEAGQSDVLYKAGETVMANFKGMVRGPCPCAATSALTMYHARAV